MVPPFVTNPIWSLQPWPLTLSVSGQEYEIPATPAAQWLAVLLTEGLMIDEVVLELLHPDDEQALEEALLSGDIDTDELYEACLDLIEAASGRKWYVAMRLVFVVKESWNTLGGEIMLQGVDATHLSLAGWLDAVFLLMLRGMKRENVTMFLSQLEMPPPQERQEAMEEIEVGRDQFMSMMS